MNFDMTNIVAGLLFGLIGFGGWKYGKNIGSGRKLWISGALMFYPYLVENNYLLWGIGVLLTCALIFWRE